MAWAYRVSPLCCLYSTRLALVLVVAVRGRISKFRAVEDRPSRAWQEWKQNIFFQMALGGFHLHLLAFPFVYQFNSRIGVLVHSSFANDLFRSISTTFQHHFKKKLLWFLHEKVCSFYTNLFYCTEMR